MRRVPFVIGAVALVAAGVAGGALLFDSGEQGPRSPDRTALSAADIRRGDLIDTITVDGTLTYAAERRITAQAAGTVTSVPSQGRVVRQGGTLYAVDRRPVVLMHGTVPLYRTLGPGVTAGPDVRQLENALQDLGYGDGLTVDRTFSAATARAVRRWQKDKGLKQTGSVDAAQVVFLPSDARVVEAKAAVGDRIGPGRPVLSVTGTHHVVHVDLDADEQETAQKGRTVSVQLPGGATATGRITSVGTVAHKKNTQGDTPTSGQSPSATIDVEITLTGGKRSSTLDQAPVTVTMESRRRSDVLSVPVEALLALREGGFGVEVVDPGGTRRIVAVTTGMYGGGRVEISGAGLTPGMKVGVPAQ
ncbi:hypothetical protein GCM10029978_018730 [Actinoallomurus acanthiterrae]